MKPREFIARVIDLFDFDLGPNWSQSRPRDLTTAHMQMSVALKTPGFDDIRKVVNSYLFVLETASELGVSTIRASMVPVKDKDKILNQPLLTGVRATMCFVVLDDSGVRVCDPDEKPDEDHLFETWSLPSDYCDRSDEIMEMLTYLVLKTNYHMPLKSKD